MQVRWNMILVTLNRPAILPKTNRSLQLPAQVSQQRFQQRVGLQLTPATALCIYLVDVIFELSGSNCGTLNLLMSSILSSCLSVLTAVNILCLGSTILHVSFQSGRRRSRVDGKWRRRCKQFVQFRRTPASRGRFRSQARWVSSRQSLLPCH